MGGTDTDLHLRGTCCRICAPCRHYIYYMLEPADKSAALFWSIRPHYPRWVYLVCHPFSMIPPCSSRIHASGTSTVYIRWPCNARLWRWTHARIEPTSIQLIASRRLEANHHLGLLVVVPSPQNLSLPYIDHVRSRRINLEILSGTNIRLE